jgi:NAD(P)-dependent dehydrogenase (short-subunit alcohol dehydrogenase family)
MQSLAGKKVVVVGGSMGVGRAIVALAHRDGAEVLAVARGADALDTLAAESLGVATMVADATLPETAGLVLRAIAPDVLALSAGAIPPMRSFFELGWEEFSANSNADVKASFLFCKAAIEHPFPRDAAIVRAEPELAARLFPAATPAPSACKCSLPSTANARQSVWGSTFAFWRSCQGASCLRLVWARQRLRVMLAI